MCTQLPLNFSHPELNPVLTETRGVLQNVRCARWFGVELRFLTLPNSLLGPGSLAASGQAKNAAQESQPWGLQGMGFLAGWPAPLLG